jgi:Gram-negative bacterial TonB protein C-terminal
MNILRRSFIPSLCAALLAKPSGAEVLTPIYVRKFLMPTYPNIVRKLYIQGDVSAKVGVLGNGIVQTVAAVSGPEPLRESVEYALKRWEFVVPSREQVDLQITFSFILDENQSDACIFQISGSLPDRFEIRVNYGPHMK